MGHSLYTAQNHSLCFTGDLHVDTVLSVSPGQVTKYVFPVGLRHTSQVAIQDKSILITSTANIRVVQENQETHSTDNALMYPISSLGGPSDTVEYYAASWDQSHDCRILLLTAYDNTTVTINSPTANIRFNNKNYPKNKAFDIVFKHKYQTLQLSSATGFSGTYISSNKVIVAMSGNRKARVPNLKNGNSGDHLIEELLPVKTWGTDFIITPLPYSTNPREARIGDVLARYKILGGEDGTQVTINVFNRTTGEQVDTEQFSLTAGSVYNRDHNRDTIGVVKANKGIMIYQFATTMERTAGNCMGDPWMQSIAPIQDAYNDYPLVTSNLTSNYCPAKHFITIIIDKEVKEGVMINRELFDWTTCRTKGLCAEIPTTNKIYMTVNIGELNVHNQSLYIGK